MATATATLKKLKDVWYRGLLARAHAAGMQAANAVTPVPMIVQQHASVMDDNSPVVKQWACAGGVCGFAWIDSPANTEFGRWAAKHAEGWRKNEYKGGLTYWVSLFGQSMEKKVAYAAAYTRALREAGVERVYSNSRMD